MNQRRRRLLFALPADVGPEVSKKTDILDKFFFTATFGRRTHDESTGEPVAMLVDDSFQAQAFFIRSDFSRNADMIDSWHINKISARQRDVRRDARALFAERLFGHLNQDLLAFAKQFRDHRIRFRRIAVAAPFFGLSRRRSTSASTAPGPSIR